MDILSGFLWHPWISNINGICWDFINLSHLLEVCWLCKKSWNQHQTCETDLESSVINSESEIMMKLLWEDVTWLVLRNLKGSKFKSIIILIITNCGYLICAMSQCHSYHAMFEKNAQSFLLSWIRLKKSFRCSLHYLIISLPTSLIWYCLC